MKSFFIKLFLVKKIYFYNSVIVVVKSHADSVTVKVKTQLAVSTEMVNPQPNVQSNISNFSHPLLSTSVSII
jgi:hypothetical protein